MRREEVVPDFDPCEAVVGFFMGMFLSSWRHRSLVMDYCKSGELAMDAPNFTP
jgi:hypothetical protein